jgi:tetratricopeptide (TPR) repeat protein
MIVKDEEHVIERALESCYKMLDSYCIVDTGSTDNTKQVIKNFFDSKGIVGKIVDFPFTNFEECRNKSIEEGKELGDYGFWMDADEILELNPDFSKSKLNLLFTTNSNIDEYLINCKYGHMNYNRSQFYKFSSNYEWYGPVHEILRKKDKTRGKVAIFDLGNMKIVPDGNSWKGDISKKYEDHAEILLNYQEKNNWEDPRWTFYLGQSYRDAGNFSMQQGDTERGKDLLKKSINYYKERVKDNRGYQEERYYSQLMISRMYYTFESDEFIIMQLLKCEELDTNNRCEHIFNIVSYLQKEQMHKNAIEFCKLALKKLKLGNTSSLFLENMVYDWAMYDMYGVSLFYIGNFEEALKYFKYALKKGNEKGSLDDTNRKRIENNIKSTEVNLAKR